MACSQTSLEKGAIKGQSNRQLQIILVKLLVFRELMFINGPNGLASHPGGSSPSHFMLQKPEICAGLMGLLGS